MIKTFVVDSNVILNDWTIPFSLKNANVVIPQIVIQELDKKQDFINKSTSYNARAFCRRIKSLLKEQKTFEIKLTSGILKLIPTDMKALRQVVDALSLDPDKNDSFITAQAWVLKQEDPDVVLLTGDTNMWVTAHAIGLPVEDYEVTGAGGREKIYSGVATIKLEDPLLIEEVYNGASVKLSEQDFPDLHMNQILVLKSPQPKHAASLIVMFKGYDKPIKRLQYLP